MLTREPRLCAAMYRRCAAAVDFLISPDASFVTGADLVVDVGVTAAVRAGMPRFERSAVLNRSQGGVKHRVKLVAGEGQVGEDEFVGQDGCEVG